MGKQKDELVVVTEDVLERSGLEVEALRQALDDLWCAIPLRLMPSLAAETIDIATRNHEIRRQMEER